MKNMCIDRIGNGLWRLPPLFLLVEDQERTLWIRAEGAYLSSTTAEQCFDPGCRSIADSNPNHFWRMPEEKTTLMEVSVLLHSGKTLLHGIIPDDCISRLL